MIMSFIIFTRKGSSIMATLIILTAASFSLYSLLKPPMIVKGEKQAIAILSPAAEEAKINA
jgi:hypothetical protein